MGQSGSVCCCCCGSDKRASSVQNESLQEKLLDGGDEAKAVVVHGDAADPRRASRKMSSSRDPRVTQGMMPMGVDGSEDDTSEGSRDRMDEIEDDEDADGADNAKKKHLLSTSYRPSVNEWGLSQVAHSGFDSALPQEDLGFSDRDLGGFDESSVKMERLTSDVSARDSYASARDVVESTHEADNKERRRGDDDERDLAQEAVLRRRSMPRPSSSRVFEEDEDSTNSMKNSNSRELRELESQDEGRDRFGSFSSETSSMRSFLVRNSDETAPLTPIYHTQNVADGSETSAVTDEGANGIPRKLSGSPRSKSKKKGKKRR